MEWKANGRNSNSHLALLNVVVVVFRGHVKGREASVSASLTLTCGK